ncbi:uncharacterized protein LOC143300705 isoform X2 [Babylonia areolata]|uniref:uncharacterized protein LOC143300705 isoform X2 n=1 Tax=Babylonia areolata TaxID=304850 RepID=UPI003FD5B437
MELPTAEFLLPTWRKYTQPPRTQISDCTAAAAGQNKAKKPGKLTPSQAAVSQQLQFQHRLHKGRTHQAQGQMKDSSHSRISH